MEDINMSHLKIVKVLFNFYASSPPLNHAPRGGITRRVKLWAERKQLAIEIRVHT